MKGDVWLTSSSNSRRFLYILGIYPASAAFPRMSDDHLWPSSSWLPDCSADRTFVLFCWSIWRALRTVGLNRCARNRVFLVLFTAVSKLPELPSCVFSHPFPRRSCDDIRASNEFQGSRAESSRSRTGLASIFNNFASIHQSFPIYLTFDPSLSM